MKTLGLLIAIFSCGLYLFLSSCNYALVDEPATNLKIREACEKAYFEGQRDAITGDIRIELTSDSIYIWTKSCWDDSTRPIFNPTYLDTKHNTNF